jgi:hypothetical protein
MDGDEIRANLRHQIKRHRKAVDVFADELKDVSRSSIDRLEWADSTFESAAHVFVYEKALRLVEKEDDPVKACVLVLDVASKEVFNSARWPSSSTSSSSNYAHIVRGAAWADLHDQFEGLMNTMMKDQSRQEAE